MKLRIWMRDRGFIDKKKTLAIFYIFITYDFKRAFKLK